MYLGKRPRPHSLCDILIHNQLRPHDFTTVPGLQYGHIQAAHCVQLEALPAVSPTQVHHMLLLLSYTLFHSLTDDRHRHPVSDFYIHLLVLHGIGQALI